MKKGMLFGLIGLGVATIGLGYFAYRKIKGDSFAIGGDEYEAPKVTKRWNFEDNYFTGSGHSSSNLGFIGSTIPPFKVGDRVNVQQNAGAKYPQYNGITTVEYIFKTTDGKYVIDVAKARLGDTPVNGGVITNA